MNFLLKIRLGSVFAYLFFTSVGETKRLTRVVELAILII